MRFDNARGDRQPQAGAAAFEFGAPGGVQFNFADLVQFLENDFVVGRVDTDAGIFYADFQPAALAVVGFNAGADGDAAAIRRVFDCVDDNAMGLDENR